MHIRGAGVPDEPDDEYEEPSGIAHESDGSLTFRVPGHVIAGKFAIAAVLLVLAFVAGGGAGFWLALLAAVAVALYGLRDVLGRERLHADGEGIRVSTGLRGYRELAWPDVERLRVDRRLRLGLRTELLELDAGEQLFLLSRYDLGVEPHAALAALETVREVSE